MKVGRMARTIACALAAGFPLVAFAGPATDADTDGVVDVVDNCLTIPNPGTAGCDTDIDGYGNICDCDYDNNGVCDSSDFVAFFYPDFLSSIDGGTGTDADCSGTVDSSDFVAGFFPGFSAGAPGPSGLSCAGNIPCK